MLFFVLLLLARDASCFNILVLSPAFASSHTNFMAHIADTLTDAGHNVTFLVPIIDEVVRSRLGVKKTKDVVVVERDEEMQQTRVMFDNMMDTMWNLDVQYPAWEKSFSFWHKLMEASCGNLLRNGKVLEEMRDRRFDVAILEPLSVCGLAFFRRLNIEKVAVASSCALYDVVLANTGESNELSYVPSLTSPTNDRMGIVDRLRNYLFYREYNQNMEKMFDAETRVYQRLLGKDIPDWRELLPEASVFFVNSNPYLDFPRPVLQKTVPIGGITVDFDHIKSQKLSEEWDEILSRREQNMLISFGSMVKSSEMPVGWKRNLLEVIKSEPNVTFIWKYESEDVSFAAGIENVVFSKWVPQPALLNDPRLTAFLTHGGLGSTMELAHCGKPAVMVPVFCDQVRNAHMLARQKSAVTVWKTDLASFETVKNAMKTILYDESYRKNAVHLANLINDQPHKPKDLVVKHVEFLAKNGPFPQMDPSGRHLNFFQKTFLDVFALAVVLFFVLAIMTVVLLRKCASRIVKLQDKTKKL